MLTISKPLSAAQVCTYHAEDFTNARANYYTGADQIRGQWHGQLARTWGLSGDVQDIHIQRLAQGQHPLTGARLVQHQTARTYTNEYGERVTTMAHRAAWDATFSAPKSVSLTALVGCDPRVREAHRASVGVALDELEKYVQARIGRNHPAETTGKWIAATFEHDRARPVDGYAAPQLHTHVVFFNVTERANGESRALQPRELYKAQAFATAIYRSEVAASLTAVGYEIERGDSEQPEVRGYTREYLAASSPRRQQIEEHLAMVHQHGAEAAQIAAHQTRDRKIDQGLGEMEQRDQELAATHEHQAAHVVQAARDRGHCEELEQSGMTPHTAVTFGKDRNFEREAVVEERDVLRDALRRSMGVLTLTTIKPEFDRRVDAGEFISVATRPGAPGQAFTTREMIDLERDTIQVMRASQHTYPALVRGITGQDLEQRYPHLNEGQRAAVEHLLASQDQVVALEGVAGGGKTTALAAVRDAAELAGYTVEGLAPTSRAAQQLEEAGLSSGTLQRHLARGERPAEGSPHLYVLDESSLASTKQMNDFLHRLHAEDRVLLVGDVRQHQAVDAGRPYQQLQEAGIDMARIDGIVRQQDPALKQVVEDLARGNVRDAIQQLEEQGRVQEIPRRNPRLIAIAREYARDPDGTLVVSPDNQSRQELNQIIHRRMQSAGHVDRHEHRVHVLIARQDVTGADRQWAAQYAPGDVVRYAKGSKVLDVKAGDYARVEQVHARENLVIVTRETGEPLRYDPRRLQGVTLYREATRAFATGDRVQLTAPCRERHVANRELGTIEQIDAGGDLRLRLDSGRTVAFNIDAHPHLDYGYAVTSHSSQGQTADRVLVHVDTERVGEQLVNRRLAYVAVSRGRYDAQIYTNDKAQLGDVLSRDVSHPSAIEASRAIEPPAQKLEPTSAQKLEPSGPRQEAQLGIGR